MNRILRGLCLVFSLLLMLLLEMRGNLMCSGAELPPPAETIRLYEAAAPGAEDWDWSERAVTTASGLPVAQDVAEPVLMYYPADPKVAVGTAMIVAPGGGFRSLMMSYEGVEPAKRLNEMGVDAFILKYRLLYTGPNATPPQAKAAQSTGDGPQRYTVVGTYKSQAGQDLGSLAADDGRQAVRFLRERAGEWNIRPGRLGLLGFSAGGMVASETLFGPPETRPDFAAIIYGVGLPRQVPDRAPPLFLTVAADDAISVDAVMAVFQAYRTAGAPVELHYYQSGGHGFRNPGSGADRFMDRVEEWLRGNGLLGNS